MDSDVNKYPKSLYHGWTNNLHDMSTDSKVNVHDK